MSKPLRVAVALLVLLVGAGVGTYLLFFDGEDASEATLDNALGGAGTTTTTGDDTTGTQAAGGIDGTWTVVPSDDIEFGQTTGTFAGFRIQEELGGIGATEAVGRTGQVSGSMTIAGSVVTAARFEVDLTSIRSNESRRESRIQEALETDRFPNATFELTEPIELGADAASGGEQSATATGDLTVHGVTRSVRFPLKAKLAGDRVAVAGQLDITFADYDVEVPSAPVVISVEDHGPIELQLVLQRA